MVKISTKSASASVQLMKLASMLAAKPIIMAAFEEIQQRKSVVTLLCENLGL